MHAHNDVFTSLCKPDVMCSINFCCIFLFETLIEVLIIIVVKHQEDAGTAVTNKVEIVLGRTIVLSCMYGAKNMAAPVDMLRAKCLYLG